MGGQAYSFNVLVHPVADFALFSLCTPVQVRLARGRVKVAWLNDEVTAKKNRNLMTWNSSLREDDEGTERRMGWIGQHQQPQLSVS